MYYRQLIDNRLIIDIPRHNTLVFPWGKRLWVWVDEILCFL